MAQYIKKSALLAEIKKLEDEAKIYPSSFDCGRLSICKELMNFLDTLKEKEVDLEKEIDDYINEHFSEYEDGVLISDANSKELTLLDVMPMARHFYELGLKEQLKNK